MSDERDEGTWTAVPMAHSPARQRHVIAFTGPAWSGAAVFPRLSGPPDDPVVVLSDIGVIGTVAAPAIFSAGERTVVVHAGSRGAEVRRLDRDKGRLLFPDATAHAVAAGRRRSRVFAVDRRGLLTTTYGADEEEEQRWIEQSQAGRPLLAAARAGEVEIAFLAWAGQRTLFVATEVDGKPRVVRHDLRAACVGLDAVGAGNRAGVAMAMEDGAIDVAVADVRGALVERVSTCLQGRGAAWLHPRVLWTEDAFAVLACDDAARRTVLADFDRGRIRADISGASGPFCAAYSERALYVARAAMDEDTDEVAVRGHRLTLTGDAATFPFAVTIQPPASLWRARASLKAERLVRATVTELSTAIERTGYRGGPEAGSIAELVTDDALALHIEPLHATLGATRVGLRLCDQRHDGAESSDEPGGVGFDVTLVALSAGARDEPAPEGSFERLARWVRQRVSKEAFAAALAERSWIESCAAPLGGRAFWDRDENGLRLIIHLRRLPDAASLTAWVRRVLHDLATRAWEKTGAPPHEDHSPR